MNPTLAARTAGYADKSGAASVRASTLRKRPEILALIARFEREGPDADVSDVLGEDLTGRKSKAGQSKAIVLQGTPEGPNGEQPDPDAPPPLIEADKLYPSPFYSISPPTQQTMLLEAAEMAAGKRARPRTIIIMPRALPGARSPVRSTVRGLGDRGAAAGTHRLSVARSLAAHMHRRTRRCLQYAPGIPNSRRL